MFNNDVYVGTRYIYKTLERYISIGQEVKKVEFSY